MSSPDLLSIAGADRGLDALLPACGRILKSYLLQDSGCVSYVVETSGHRLFVKGAVTPAGGASLGRTEALHAGRTASRPSGASERLRDAHRPAHVYAWVPGEVLYDVVAMRGEKGRQRPESGHARFRALPLRRVLDAMGVI